MAQKLYRLQSATIPLADRIRFTPEEFADLSKWRGCPIPLNRGLEVLYSSINSALGVSEIDLRSRTNSRVSSHARYIFYAMLREFYQIGPTEASKIWGKGHCNYLYAIAKHNEYAESEKNHEYRNKYLRVFDLFVKEAVDVEGTFLPKKNLNATFVVRKVNSKVNKKVKPALEQKLQSKFDTAASVPKVTRLMGTVTLEMIEQRLRTQGARQSDLEKVLHTFKGKGEGVKFTELEVSLTCNNLGVNYIQ